MSAMLRCSCGNEVTVPDDVARAPVACPICHKMMDPEKSIIHPRLDDLDPDLLLAPDDEFGDPIPTPAAKPKAPQPQPQPQSPSQPQAQSTSKPVDDDLLSWVDSDAPSSVDDGMGMSDDLLSPSPGQSSPTTPA